MEGLCWKTSIILIALQACGVINVKWYILLSPVIVATFLLLICLVFCNSLSTILKEAIKKIDELQGAKK